MRRLRVAALVLGAAAAGLAGCTPSAGGLAGGAPDSTVSTPPSTPESTATPPGRSSAPEAEGPSACPTGGEGAGGSSKVSYADPTGGSGGSGGSDARAVAVAGGARVESAAEAASAARAAPWKDRPAVTLCFDIPADRRVVRGTESVTFTPDRRTCEVVFRAWPNKPETARAGNRLDVTAVAVDGQMTTPKVEAAGAPPGSPGTLIRIPLQSCLSAGKKAQVELAFTLTVGADTPERVGFSSGDRTIWLATAYPLLAWQRGKGWVTDPAVDLFGETTTSEEFRLDQLDVVVPKGDEVLGTGQELGVVPSSRAGSVVHQFRANAVRDVAITAGRLDVVERVADGVRVHVGAAPGSVAPAGEWADATVSAVKELSAYLGPFPYDDLWVTIAPDVPSGIELPGAIQFGNVRPSGYPELVPHEVAHMWFYGLVGNDQARDPWMDESFAEYAEVLVDGTAERSLRAQIPTRVRDRVGESMQWYASLRNPDLYAVGVYRQGGAMLHRARQAVGPATFDRLLRGYIDSNAHRIATPNDVARAFASQPRVIEILRQYGALPR
ncbi:M1 family aminopeptidase [Actinopolymorpha pittospori]|uniref:Peptidase M1 membrane alanine aminopeptidase domain-containing protein n=1 Tax=Actinopolymorpha pittospori TaxID=648752 RepID=A0A927MZ44_9ACTN|nr:hypothetical protein [Actinopolymorpha pittospori]